VDLLRRTTDWDRRDYWYFSTWRPTLREGDRVILFDLTERSLGAVEIRDVTRTPERTPDGRHLAAYRRTRGLVRRRLVPNRWKALKAAGLLRRKDDAYLTRKLSKERFDLYLGAVEEVVKQAGSTPSRGCPRQQPRTEQGDRYAPRS
jgi:hypothetical protein